MSTVSCFWTTRGSIIATRCEHPPARIHRGGKNIDPDEAMDRVSAVCSYHCGYRVPVQSFCIRPSTWNRSSPKFHIQYLAYFHPHRSLRLPIGVPHHFLHSLAKHAHGRQSAPLELERPQVALLCRHRERHVDWLLYRYHLSILAGHHLRLALTRYSGSLSFSGILCRIWGLAGLSRSAPFPLASGASRSGTPGRSAFGRRSLLGAAVRLRRLYRGLRLGRGPRRFVTEGLVQRAPPLALPLSHRRPPPKPSRTPPGTEVGPRIRPRSA